MSADLRYLGWAAFSIRGDNGAHVIVDPDLRGRASHGVPPSPVSLSELSDADLICVTHAADDHFGQCVELAQASGAILCGAIDVRLRAVEQGLPESQTRLLVPGAWYEAAGARIKALPAQHLSFSRVGGQYVTGVPLMFLIEVGGAKIFHCGDTSISSEFALYGQLYSPTVVLVGVDGAFDGERAITELEPDEAALVVEMLGARLAFPMHYRIESGAAESFLAAVSRRTPEVRATTLAPGASISVDGSAR
jgi:L-ascorbate metabolism protein UlaG (beta-lactamase superfamily)